MLLLSVHAQQFLTMYKADGCQLSKGLPTLVQSQAISYGKYISGPALQLQPSCVDGSAGNSLWVGERVLSYCEQRSWISICERATCVVEAKASLQFRKFGTHSVQMTTYQMLWVLPGSRMTIACHRSRNQEIQHSIVHGWQRYRPLAWSGSIDYAANHVKTVANHLTVVQHMYCNMRPLCWFRHGSRRLTRGKVLGRASWSVASSSPALSSTASRCLRPSKPCTTLVRSRQSMQLVRTTPRCRSRPSACAPSRKNPSRWKSSFSWSHSNDKLHIREPSNNIS